MNSEIHEQLRCRVAEHFSRFDARSRRTMARWLQHMIALGVVTDVEVAQALSDTRPCVVLNRLYSRSTQRLAQHLSAVTASHAREYDKPFREAVVVSLAADIDASEPAIELRMTGYLEVPVSTLHRVPAPLASMAYESLCLVSSCFVPLLMPDELWSGEGLGWNEGFREEYAELRKAGGIENLQAVEALVREKEFDHFSTHRSELTSTLENAQEMFDERPLWMTPMYSKTPVSDVRRLRRQLAQYTRQHGPHPWGEYIDYVCRVVRASFKDDLTFQRYQRRLAAARLDYHDQDMAIFYGLWVNSGGNCECNNAEDLFTNMGQAGEEPVERYSLSRLASKPLQQILDCMAIGIGLLLRAGATNTEVRGIPS